MEHESLPTFLFSLLLCEKEEFTTFCYFIGFAYEVGLQSGVMFWGNFCSTTQPKQSSDISLLPSPPSHTFNSLRACQPRRIGSCVLPDSFLISQGSFYTNALSQFPLYPIWPEESFFRKRFSENPRTLLLRLKHGFSLAACTNVEVFFPKSSHEKAT